MDDDDSKAAIKAAITAASPDEAEGPRKMTPNACTQCRRVKMKCLFRDGRDVCERCTRLQMECVRERHRRGRKLGTRLKPTANGTHEVVFVEDRPPPSAPLPPATETDESRENTWTGNLWADVDGFQPPDLLNKPEEKGRLSLQAILNGSVPSKRVVSDAAASEKDAQLGPIAVGIINRPVAMSLFEEFMRHFNPWICQFDPALHTFEYVRDRSPLLFTVILATAARAFNPALREPLQAHAERLLSRSVIHGPKSVEVAHAILVVTCWKEPEDTRTWMLVGHAIRMAHELGWHRMQLGGSGGDQTAETRRRRRDVERVWLLLFVCDRNLSFQTGNPWMIERSEVFLEARDSWGRDSLAAPHDQMLCALLDLRLLTSDTFRPSHPKHRGSDPGTTAAAAEVSQFDQRGSLVRIISHDVDRWQRRWMQTPALAAVPCHVLLLRLYGAHLRLLLASSPLEASLATHGAVDKRALWQTFSSAVDMLHALCDPPLQPSLYFAYDSIHVETAYAAVFLVKLCLRLPLETSSELEPVARDSLRATRHTFSRQAAPANSVCALQASFLANVLRAFDTAMRARRLEQAKTGHPVDAAGEPRSQPTAPASSASPAVRPGPAWPTPWAEGTDMSVDPSPAGPSSSPAAAQAPLRMVPPAFPGWRTGEDSVAFGDRGGAFPDDEVWSTMFTNSGFSIDSGTFTHSM